ncbi:O-methyltransferase [Bacilliculturomica massiliensis]|uniref:O-methyltransferase n=1 Tax=Bacilliculturomica massiliensis TaxID=1917867 RepID=UPI0013EF4C92|nr:O-methyltransferase [Bacilliculturomica massiliensis]
MNIVTEPVTEYLDSLYRPANDFLAELRRTCEEQMIPIVLRDAESLILQLLRLQRPERILEIGTAAGYSAIAFALECPEAKIVTLELSERSADTARENIERAGCSDSIWVLGGDARESLARLAAAYEAEGKETGQPPELFDFVFIDAAKGHYQEFWDGAAPLMKEGCLVVSDNVLFKGMTASDQFIPERRQKTITNRMRSFLRFLTQTEGIRTAVLPVGDGVAVSIVGKAPSAR